MTQEQTPQPKMEMYSGSTYSVNENGLALDYKGAESQVAKRQAAVDLAQSYLDSEDSEGDKERARRELQQKKEALEAAQENAELLAYLQATEDIVTSFEIKEKELFNSVYDTDQQIQELIRLRDETEVDSVVKIFDSSIETAKIRVESLNTQLLETQTKLSIAKLYLKVQKSGGFNKKLLEIFNTLKDNGTDFGSLKVGEDLLNELDKYYLSYSGAARELVHMYDTRDNNNDEKHSKKDSYLDEQISQMESRLSEAGINIDDKEEVVRISKLKPELELIKEKPTITLDENADEEEPTVTLDEKDDEEVAIVEEVDEDDETEIEETEDTSIEDKSFEDAVAVINEAINFFKNDPEAYLNNDELRKKFREAVELVKDSGPMDNELSTKIDQFKKETEEYKSKKAGVERELSNLSKQAEELLIKFEDLYERIEDVDYTEKLGEEVNELYKEYQELNKIYEEKGDLGGEIVDKIRLSLDKAFIIYVKARSYISTVESQEDDDSDETIEKLEKPEGNRFTRLLNKTRQVFTGGFRKRAGTWMRATGNFFNRVLNEDSVRNQKNPDNTNEKEKKPMQIIQEKLDELEAAINDNDRKELIKTVQELIDNNKTRIGTNAAERFQNLLNNLAGKTEVKVTPKEEVEEEDDSFLDIQ